MCLMIPELDSVEQAGAVIAGEEFLETGLSGFAQLSSAFRLDLEST